MGKRVEHHQTVVVTYFRVVDDHMSYDPPQPYQQVALVLSDQEFLGVLQNIREHLADLQKALDRMEEQDASEAFQQSD